MKYIEDEDSFQIGIMLICLFALGRSIAVTLLLFQCGIAV